MAKGQTSPPPPVRQDHWDDMDQLLYQKHQGRKWYEDKQAMKEYEEQDKFNLERKIQEKLYAINQLEALIHQQVTPEKKVKDKVKKVLIELGCYFIMPSTGGYGNSGVPDFVLCLRGKFIGIECKAGKNIVTALQASNLNQITQAGGNFLVVDEKTGSEELKLALIYIMEN